MSEKLIRVVNQQGVAQMVPPSVANNKALLLKHGYVIEPLPTANDLPEIKSEVEPEAIIETIEESIDNQPELQVVNTDENVETPKEETKEETIKPKTATKRKGRPAGAKNKKKK